MSNNRHINAKLFMSDRTVLSRFVAAAFNFPDRNAFCINESFYTYAEFWDVISRIRTQLREHPIENGRLGLVAHDDLYTYASIFAAWMEGFAYIPLHPKHPSERNHEVIAQAGLNFVLDSRSDFVFRSADTIDTKASASLNPTTETVSIDDDALAYILFTSGSTGKPKGVPITRDNLAAFMDVFPGNDIHLNEHDRCLQCFDLTFDISVQCYLFPLLNGACVYTVPHDQIKFTYVYGLLDDHELTLAVLAPSMIHHLRPYFEEIYLEKLRYCFLVAEATPVDLLQDWFAHIPNARVFNFYGPTEATIYCISYEAKPNEKIKGVNGLLAIGRPFEGIDAVILDENAQIAETGVKGEFYISGDQVTAGYWQNPEKNYEAFKIVDYKGEQQRFYKTGDLCQIDEDGDILYYGRADYQVKIQGYRIELGEIEFHAREAIGGQNAVAFVYTAEGGSQQIALCLEAESFDEKAILHALGVKLPAYMMPIRLFNIDRFPLNTSDKVDRGQIKSALPI